MHGSGKQSSFRFSHFIILAAGPDPEEEAGGGVEEDEGEGGGEAGPHRHDPSRHVTSRSSRVTLGSVWCPHTGEVSIQLITHRHNPGPPASGDPEWGEGDK